MPEDKYTPLQLPNQPQGPQPIPSSEISPASKASKPTVEATHFDFKSKETQPKKSKKKDEMSFFGETNTTKEKFKKIPKEKKVVIDPAELENLEPPTNPTAIDPLTFIPPKEIDHKPKKHFPFKRIISIVLFIIISFLVLYAVLQLARIQLTQI